MRVLIIIPNAELNEELKVGVECREIQNCLYSSPFSSEHSIIILQNGRLKDIRRRIICEKPDIVHICGHGSETEGLLIEGLESTPHFLEPETLGDFFNMFSDSIHVVYLSLCSSSKIAESISQYINCVIGFKEKIKDTDAIEFATGFYDGVFNKMSIEDSFSLACNSLKWISSSVYPEPVLFKKRYLPYAETSSNKRFVKVSPSRLPRGINKFLGREKEILFLDNAWERKVNLICIEAWGGVGKTTLISHWRSEVIQRESQRADGVSDLIVFDWSFYNQGNLSNRPISTDSFFNEAFKWFGITNTSDLYDRGELLAMEVRNRNSLVILDGLESMQYSDNIVGKEGEIKDKSLRIFVSMLSEYNKGTCIITTRKRVSNLTYNEKCVLYKLPQFDEQESIFFLHSIGVYGTEQEEHYLYNMLKGHALSLRLTANYIRTVFKGNISQFQKDRCSMLDADDGYMAIRIMKSYEQWYGDSGYIRILRILGLFDRPAKQEEIQYLISAPEIVDLTDGLYCLSAYEIGKIIRSLKRASLIVEFETEDVCFFDAHPLVKEYFHHNLELEYHEAFKEGNYRLYTYFCKKASDEEDAFEKMNYWFRAVYHGCYASRSTEVFENVYLPHMKQNENIYDARKLGGNSTNLNAIAAFFKSTWTEVRKDLSDKYHASVYAEASFALSVQGRLLEAVNPLVTAIEREAFEEHWTEAAMLAGNLSEIYLNIGETDKSLEYAEMGISFAEKSKKVWRHYWVQLAKKADLYSKIGLSEYATALFYQAERVQALFDPEAIMLYGVLAFKKYDALLSDIERNILVPFRLKMQIHLSFEEMQKCLTQINEAKAGINEALEHDKKYDRFLHLALDRLIYYRLEVLEKLLKQEYDGDKLENMLNEVVSILYKSGRIEYIPYGLIASSCFYNLEDQGEKMLECLEKLEDTIRNCSLMLFDTDLLVEKAYYNILIGDYYHAGTALDSALQLANITKYERKIREIKVLVEFLNGRGHL